MFQFTNTLKNKIQDATKDLPPLGALGRKQSQLDTPLQRQEDERSTVSNQEHSAFALDDESSDIGAVNC